MEKIHALIEIVGALLDSDDEVNPQEKICNIINDEMRKAPQGIACKNVPCKDCFFNSSTASRENKESKEQLAKLKLILNMAE